MAKKSFTGQECRERGLPKRSKVSRGPGVSAMPQFKKKKREGGEMVRGPPRNRDAARQGKENRGGRESLSG